MLVSILIASMGRESLATTLASIKGVTIPAGHEIEVIIADDAVGSPVVTQLARWNIDLPTRVIQVGARNVSLARNAAMDSSRGDWLLFVDDDEYVEPAWLAEHLAAAELYTADVVFAPVFEIYPAQTPDWFRRADPIFHDMGWSTPGKRVAFGQSGNTLIRASALRRAGIRFDPEFGRTGGEDNDFFRRFAARGAKLVVTDRARAWELVPPQRATVQYAQDRSIRLGNIYARTTLRDASFATYVGFALDALAKLALAAASSIALQIINPALAFRLRLKALSNVGKLSALGGVRPSLAWKETSL